MRSFRRLLTAALLLVVTVATVIAIRTIAYRSPLAVNLDDVRLAPAVPVDLDRASRNLAAAIRIRTVSHQDPRENDPAEWERLHAWLQATYPAAHGAMTREVVAERTLIYTWPGAEPNLPPVLLMAHQDVVPVTPGTEGDWTHPPFDGAVDDSAVWGRGAIDDKGALVAIFEALETLAGQGFKPRRTIYVVSGHDEESGGAGARAAAEVLQQRGVRPEFVLDEGMAIVKDFPLLGRPVALIGVGEKGYATLRVTARAPGGHSSAPPPETGVEVLARAVLAITGNAFPLQFDGPGADMVRALAPEASPLVRMAVANEWLFRPLLIRQIAATPQGAATLHTTIAPTMLRGSPKENVLPQDATAWINYRIAPGTTAADVMQRAQEATRGMAVELAWERATYDPPPVSKTDTRAYRVLAALAQGDERYPVAPGLVTATTDSRSMAPLTDSIYRFAPIAATLDELKMVHGTNERMTLENLRRTVEFYTRLVATTAGQ